jgi:hypothetical protein
MFIYRLTEPIDEFDGLTPLPAWPQDASPHAIRWVLQAVLALADAAPEVGWRGDMRHLPSVGGLPTTPAATPYLVIKQDDNGATFVITAAEAPGIGADAVVSTCVTSHEIGAWTHPTGDDIPLVNTDLVPTSPEVLKRQPAF